MTSSISPLPLSDLPDWRYVRFLSIDSTNSEAIRRSESDAGNLWILSDEQELGRGRHGRVWSSPIGNLYCSLLLKSELPLSSFSALPLVASVGLHRALVSVCGDSQQKFCIKWPNDIFFDNKKLAGLLLESGVIDSSNWVVLGFGVNCRVHPLDIPSTSLLAEGIDASPDSVFSALTREMSLVLDEWSWSSNFVSIRDYWLSNCLGLGERIEVRSSRSDHSGIFENIDELGCLVLLDDVGVRHKILSGDVFF